MRIRLSFAALILAVSSQLLAQVTSGHITPLNEFNQGFGLPGPLLEISPGLFAGLGRYYYSGVGSHAFLLSSKGPLKAIYEFPSDTGVTPALVQAVNGRLYGTVETSPFDNFSLDTKGSYLAYPPVGVVNAPTLSIQLPDGSLYGTEWSFNGNNAFVRVGLNGGMSVLHTFSPSEGIAYGPPILASDGNFYGISGIGNQSSSTSSLIYRLTPAGVLTTLATYPNGRSGYGVNYFPEVLIQASNGKLYGTASLGGSHQAGSIFELSLDGTYKTLYEFQSFNYGVPTFLMEATDGNLYGFAYGNIFGGGQNSLFRISKSGQFQTMYLFNSLYTGNCFCWLTQGSDGRFYATSQNGGPSSIGVAWIYDLGLPKPLPALAELLPASGTVGTRVILSGNNLLGSTTVSFNGTLATSVKNISLNYVSADVPAGATTGPVTVTTPNGSAVSTNSFTVE